MAIEITSLLLPKRSVLAGLVKSPNRWRWLAHGQVIELVVG